MPRIHPNAVIGALAVAFGLVLIFIWAPLDSANGVVFTRRGKPSIGDGLAPTVAGVFFVMPGLLLLLGAKPDDAPRMGTRDWRFLFWVLCIATLALLAMRYTGPAIALLTEGGYRPLRASAPWKYLGILFGGGVLVGGLVALVEGRLSWRAVVIAILGTLGIALFYDLPFDDLLLPPNGDV